MSKNTLQTSKTNWPWIFAWNTRRLALEAGKKKAPKLTMQTAWSQPMKKTLSKCTWHDATDERTLCAHRSTSDDERNTMCTQNDLDWWREHCVHRMTLIDEGNTVYTEWPQIMKGTLRAHRMTSDDERNTMCTQNDLDWWKEHYLHTEWPQITKRTL